MKFVLSGYNAFYEGWLARVLLKNGDGHHEPPDWIAKATDSHQPADRTVVFQGESMDLSNAAGRLTGWKTADESYGGASLAMGHSVIPGIGDVLLMEIDKGHIIVDLEPPAPAQT